MKMFKPKPNLFIIGAMKAGTSSLSAYLSMHPHIFMCNPKEPHYFVEQLNWTKGEKWYLSLFESATGIPVVGEASTGYTKLPKFVGVPQRIAQFNPEAKFIYIMRDPIERTISHYWHAVRHNREQNDILTAIQNNPHYIHVSDYATQLIPYFEIFGKERVFTLTLEELRANPLKTISNIFAWLGVDACFRPSNLGEKLNVTPYEIYQIRGRNLLTNLIHSSFVEFVKPFVPSTVYDIVRRVAKKRIVKSCYDVDKVIDFLKPIQVEQTASLSRLLNRQFIEWKTLFD